ncbi:hypothetical protein L873DRAFT_1724311, partial [Choiromyces venosus 120613-1]
CCARVLIVKELNFEAQKSHLQEEVELTHYLVHFLPKYHYELNFIKYYWGAVTHYARKRYGYHIRAL